MRDIEVIESEGAPAAIGPYSQAIACKASGLLFVSGQIPIDPKTSALVDGGIAEQTAQVLKNLDAILVAAGTARWNVVQTTVYLTSLEDFAAMNEVYAEFFGDHRPARATVQVSALPKGAKVEIAAIALLP